MVSDLDQAPIDSRKDEALICSMQDIFVNLVNDASNQIKNEAKPFQRPFIFAKMCTEQVKMLYDTGADISAVNENIFRKISVDQRPSKIEDSSNRQFCSAGGQNLQIKGKFLIPVTIGKKTVQHPFYVIKNLSEAAIMGIDFFQQHSQLLPVSALFFMERRPILAFRLHEVMQPRNYSTSIYRAN
jgi:hypothetical protein